MTDKLQIARMTAIDDEMGIYDPVLSKEDEALLKPIEDAIAFELSKDGIAVCSATLLRMAYPALLAIQATEARMAQAVEAERSLLAEASQFLSDVYNLLCPIKSEWEQAGMWTEFDETVFNKRADLNLRIHEAIRSQSNG